MPLACYLPIRPMETSNPVTSAKYVGRDIEEVPLTDHGIHVKQEFGLSSSE